MSYILVSAAREIATRGQFVSRVDAHPSGARLFLRASNGHTYSTMIDGSGDTAQVAKLGLQRFIQDNWAKPVEIDDAMGGTYRPGVILAAR